MGVETRSIRLGILLDGRAQERWVLEAVRQALAVPAVQLAAVAVAPALPRNSFAARLHRVVDGIDLQLRCRKESLFVRVDVAASLAGTTVVQIPVAQDSAGWSPTAAGVAGLRRADVDLWLCFAAMPPNRPLPPVAPFGVWGLEIGLDVAATDRWAGAVEIAAGSALTLARVVDYSASENGTLYEVFGATVTNSARRNRLISLRKAMSFFKRLLLVLTSDERARHTVRCATLAPPPSYPKKRAPTATAVLQLCWRLLTRVAANRWHALRWRDQWQIAFYFTNEHDDDRFPFERFRYLAPPKDRFWADPFAVEHEGKHFIFFEELLYRTNRGRIAAIRVFENGEHGEAQVVLERPYHLSYPFIFKWRGSLYMLPETAENRTIELYRCEKFPHRWTLERVLFENISAFDATLWRDGERWWLFVTVAEPGADPSEELHLYWSASPFGPWTAHRANPVISDARCARCAGPLFSRAGVLYRPSQDCSSAYGQVVSINRVDVLDTNVYRETEVRRITSDWRGDALRVHTFGASRRLGVIDYLVSRKAW